MSLDNTRLSAPDDGAEKRTFESSKVESQSNIVTGSESDAESLEAQYARYQQDPLQQLRLKVRRYRSAQIRQLLADPEAVDEAIFNHEVWNFETEPPRLSQKSGYKIFDTTPLTVTQIAELSTALDAGQVELHGNYIWGNASYVYGPMLRVDSATKTGYIRQALRVLNDPQLTPMQKAEGIDAIVGFGRNIATGLVMVAHPDDFAIYNEQSQSAMTTLGYPANILAAFEESARNLKERVGASDFLELDWFLYLQNHPELNSVTPLKIRETAPSYVTDEADDEPSDAIVQTNETLAAWQARQNPLNPITRQLLTELPGWLRQTFGNRITFVFFEGNGLGVLRNGRWFISVRFSSRTRMRVTFLDYVPDDVVYVRAHLSDKNTLLEYPNWQDGQPGLRFLIGTERDYALFKEMAERFMSRLDNADGVSIGTPHVSNRDAATSLDVWHTTYVKSASPFVQRIARSWLRAPPALLLKV